MGEDKKAPLPKICHTYPTMIKLATVIPYLKKIQKMYESRDTSFEFFFLPETSKFCLSRNADRDSILVHNF